MNSTEKENKELLKEFKRTRRFSTASMRKKKTQTDREYVIKKARYKCEYCEMPFPEKKLSVVRKNPKKYLPKRIDGACACRECADKKGSMNDEEFEIFLKREKLEKRKEIVDNYKEISKKVFGKYHYECIYCKIEFEQYSIPKNRKLTIDHKIPLSRGGTNRIKNLCCSCKEHNFEKGSRTAEEYIRMLKRRKRSRDNNKK